jgi:hypothetical protein
VRSLAAEARDLAERLGITVAIDDIERYELPA